MSRLFTTLSATLATLAFACQEKSASPQENPGARWEEDSAQKVVGPEFDDEDFHLSASTPRVCKKEGPIAPASGKMRLSVPVELRAKGPRAIPVSALTFTLEDEAGHEFRPTLAGCAPSIAQETIRRGQEVVGEVAFDVPQDVSTLELRYEPFLIGRKKVVARVTVPAFDGAP